MEFQYYVVEFRTPVHSTVPRAVCIPKPWVRSPILDKTAAVSFPDEPYITTVQRIVLGENYGQEWNIQMADIKFGCDNLNEAQKYALEQCIGTQAVTEQNEHNTQRNKKHSTTIDGRTPQKGRKRNADIPDDVTKAKQNKTSDTPKQNEPKQKSKATTQNLNQDRIQIEKNEREKQVLKKLSRVFENVHESFDEMGETLEQMRKTIGVIKKSIKKTVDMTNALFTIDNNTQPAIIETSAAEKDSRRRRGDSIQEDQRTFVFPDNTDKSLKWTLRHQELTEGLIELLPKSGVYVRLSELEKLDFETDSPKDAALMLLKEIFSDKALSECSVTGRGNRPAFDLYSRKVLIMYLNEYCIKRRWKTDEPSIWNFVRSKLPEFRKDKDTIL